MDALNEKVDFQVLTIAGQLATAWLWPLVHCFQVQSISRSTAACSHWHDPRSTFGKGKVLQTACGRRTAWCEEGEYLWGWKTSETNFADRPGRRWILKTASYLTAVLNFHFTMYVSLLSIHFAFALFINVNTFERIILSGYVDNLHHKHWGLKATCST